MRKKHGCRIRQHSALAAKKLPKQRSAAKIAEKDNSLDIAALNGSGGDEHGAAKEMQHNLNMQQIFSLNAEPVHSAAHLGPYDENLLERARTQWQIGDWESLAKLEYDNLQHHPDRAKLALLAAAGNLQIGNTSNAKHYLRSAQTWGCSKKLISQILVAAVHNTLGRAAMAIGHDQRAIRQFEEAIVTVMPAADIKLLGETRAVHEATKLGLLPQAAKLMGAQLATVKQQTIIDRSRVEILEAGVELLHHELSLAQQRQQLFTPQTESSIDQGGAEAGDWRARLKQKSVSQLGQDLWVLEKTGYKRGGFFVEFGATDGVLLSNTWLLEKEFGWKGICAEPNPKFFAQLQKNRQCQVSYEYIGRETGKTVEFILADVYGGSEEFANDDHHKAKRDAYVAAGQVATFTSISLDDFLEKHQAPRVIDYVSVDTEGSEYDLLSSFPFEKWDVRLFTIEHNYTGQREKIRQLLEAHGYTRTEQQWDDWYERSNT